MKTLLYTAGLMTLLGLAFTPFAPFTASAAEPATATKAADPAPEAAETTPELRPFLGVHIVSVTPQVRAQTTLEPGEGLLIDLILPKSPAAKAGFQLYDILLQAGDQKLLSAQQFTNLLHASKVGVPLHFLVLRQGKPTAIEAALEERSVAELVPLPEETQMLDQLLEQLKKHSDPTAATATASNTAASMSMSDPDGSVEISRFEGIDSATVKDPQGKVLFTGAVSTKEQRAALPAELLSRIEKLEKSAHAVGHKR
jgi:hypothetical protein